MGGGGRHDNAAPGSPVGARRVWGGEGKVVEQQIGALGNPCSSFSSSSPWLCIRRGFDKNFTLGSAIHILYSILLPGAAYGANNAAYRTSMTQWQPENAFNFRLHKFPAAASSGPFFLACLTCCSNNSILFVHPISRALYRQNKKKISLTKVSSRRIKMIVQK